MKFKYKKFLYLANDITNILLKKERVQAEENAKKLRAALIIAGAFLLLSVALNIYLILR